MLVDDTPFILVAQSRLLTSFGFNVVTANNSVDALEILKNSRIDFVITDIEMPTMRGDDLSCLIHQRFPSLPVIAITSGNLLKLALNEKARFHKILQKPLTKEKISFFKFKKYQTMSTEITVVNRSSGKRVYLGNAFPGIYFTIREAELALLLNEHKYRKIATIMKMSQRTTEYYFLNMQKKLHCSSNRHLMDVLKKSGLVEQLKTFVDIGYLAEKNNTKLTD